MWLGWPSSVVEKFIKHETDFTVDEDQLSWIVSMMDLGNVISPLVTGYVMDKVGRKMTTVALGPLFIATWFLTLYVPTTWALYVARLMAGMGKGISYTVVPVFLGEIAGVNIRGALSSVFCLQLHIGFLLEAFIGPLMSYRTLNAVSAVVPVVFFIAIVWVPESPYYLLKKNQQTKAAKCLQWYRCDDDEKMADELRQMDVNVKKEMENRSTFGEVFTSRRDRRALAIVVMACFSQRAGGISCILAYSSLILPDPAPIIAKHRYIMLFATVMVVLNFVGMALVDRVGRKPLLILSEAGMGVITLVLSFYFYLVHNGVNVSRFVWVPYACHTSFAVMFGIGVSFIPVVHLSEMFPVNIRSHCSAIASITLAICSFVTNKMFMYVSHHFGFHVMFCLFTVVNFIGAIYSCVYVLETKAKTLVEIQELLEESVKKGKENNQNNNN